MYNLINILKNIGLSDKEAVTYLAILRVGSNPASVIAKDTEINRCTTYSILESLVKKGLVSEFEKKKIKFFTALPPQKLVSYIDEKRLGLAYYKDEIQTLLPHFERIQNKAQIMPSIQFYSGKSSLAQVYHSIIQEDSLEIWTVPDKDEHLFFLRFAPEYLRRHKTLRIIQSKDNAIIKHTIRKTAELKDLGIIQPVELITRNKAVIISQKDNYGIEIINPSIVEYLKNKFEFCWKK